LFDVFHYAIGDLMLLEILQGFRNDNDYNKAKRTLVSLEQYEMFRHQELINVQTITVL